MKLVFYCVLVCKKLFLPSNENGKSVEPSKEVEWCSSPIREPRTDMLAM